MLKTYRLNNPEKIKNILQKDNFLALSKIEEEVKQIYLDVLKNKDKALLYYTQKYDKVKFTIKDIIVSEDEIKEAEKNVSPEFIKIFEKLKNRIYSYHQNIFKNFEKLNLIFKQRGIIVGEQVTPIEKVGVYIPGGVANYPSTVFMTVLPAKVAGVKEIYVVTPPQSEGKVNSYTLACCKMLGVKNIFKIGGPWSIFALTCGTNIIPPVDKIVGPGNVYVTAAKKLVYGYVDIDCLAGPSEIAILADETANPKFIASDLLSQAEHGKDAKIYLITTSLELAKEVNIEIKKQIKTLYRKEFILSSLGQGKIFLVKDIKDGIDIVNFIAPEHLEIQCKKPAKILKQIKNAGAIFLGNYSPVAIGDYIAGPSHVIPTLGSARFLSPLSVFDFIKRTSIISYDKKALKDVEREILLLSQIEGLPAHYNSVKQRLS